MSTNDPTTTVVVDGTLGTGAPAAEASITAAPATAVAAGLVAPGAGNPNFCGTGVPGASKPPYRGGDSRRPTAKPANPPTCKKGDIFKGLVRHVGSGFILVQLPGTTLCGQVRVPEFLSLKATEDERRQDRDAQLLAMKVGETVEVKVKEDPVQGADQKWSVPLSIKAVHLDKQRELGELRRSARATAVGELRVGMIISGVVKNDAVAKGGSGAPFGVFVEVTGYEVGGAREGVDGLLHWREMVNPEHTFTPGDTVDVMVIKLGKTGENGKDIIGLSAKAAAAYSSGDANDDLSEDAQTGVTAALELYGAPVDPTEGQPVNVDALAAAVCDGLGQTAGATAVTAVITDGEVSEGGPSEADLTAAEQLFLSFEVDEMVEGVIAADHGKGNGFDVALLGNGLVTGFLGDDQLGSAMRNSLKPGQKVYVQVITVDATHFSATVRKVKADEFNHYQGKTTRIQG